MESELPADAGLITSLRSKHVEIGGWPGNAFRSLREEEVSSFTCLYQEASHFRGLEQCEIVAK